MIATLVPKAGGNPVVLDRPIILIGRGADCEISLPNSVKVSRRHCFIAQCGEQYRLRDLGSTNGVRVNNKRVTEEEIRPGDEIAIADAVFTFRIDGTGATPPSAPPPPPPGGLPHRPRGPARVEPDTVHLAPNDRPGAEAADDTRGARPADEINN